ncbi:MAG: murein L,D-transpeptidase catalytic domain family protein, partial [Taibaiella sp.]|nr:murein L,D-transpeptidase catalytic domain family protein [Taibaiella sp.]
MCKRYMRKLPVIVSVLALSLFTIQAKTNEPDVQPVKVSNTISDVFNSIDFTGTDKLSYEVFAKAYTGYQHLKEANKLNTGKNILTVSDYSLSANKKRMWIIDLDSRKVLINTYVAHGQGTGEEYAQHFSNREGSHQSSIGFYVTGDTYIGKHGNSLYLHGMDEGYNSAAYERAIVVHGAGYVSSDFIAGTGRLGRSWGCPAVSNELADEVIETIKDGTCL